MTIDQHHGAGAMRGLRQLILLAAVLATAGCDLDLANPNAPAEDEVLNTADGIISLAVGLQSQYSSSVADFVRAPALVTDEWGTNTQSLIAYQSLLTGDNFSNTYGVVEAPWSSAYRVLRTANSLRDNAGNVGLDAGTVAGINVLADLFSGMAVGAIVQQYEAVPIDVTVDDPVPQPRDVVLDEVLRLLESARTGLAQAGDLTIFEGRVLADGLDLANTIDAMLGRYYLLDGQYDAAIEAAQRVDPAATSWFVFSTTDINPIYNESRNSLYVTALASFAASAEEGDQRVPYWVEASAQPTTGNPDSLVIPFNQFSAPDDPFPVYLPDEMTLIQAEAYARTGDLDTARDLINEVRTSCEADADEPEACLAPKTDTELATVEDILGQIAYERRYELYAQGLRWEDLRRFGYENSVGAPPILDFLPIPSQECDANSALTC